MKASIHDGKALAAVSPAALSAYARAAGWVIAEPYGEHSDVYAADGRPEIVLPRTQQLGDYASVVARLIGIFASAADMGEVALYHDLVTADRDVVRVRVAEVGGGSITLNDGVDLIQGARDMLLSAACSLNDPRPVYRAGANKEASEYMSRVCMGQTEQGSFVVTMLPPVIPPPMQGTLPVGFEVDIADEPIERQVTRRLAEALSATRNATERTVRGDGEVFFDAIEDGASANFCEALATLIAPFPTLDIMLTWARTRPMPVARNVVRFVNDDEPILREAARSFRSRAPRPDVRLFGFVQSLRRDESETDGAITLRTEIDRNVQSVTAVLDQSEYERAINAHMTKSAVIAEGDLERVGQRWSLLSPRITAVITGEDTQNEEVEG